MVVNTRTGYHGNRLYTFTNHRISTTLFFIELQKIEDRAVDKSKKINERMWKNVIISRQRKTRNLKLSAVKQKYPIRSQWQCNVELLSK